MLASAQELRLTSFLALLGEKQTQVAVPRSRRALKTFWVDLTHKKPILPEVLVALCRGAGYEEAIVRFPLRHRQLRARSNIGRRIRRHCEKRTQ